MRHLFNPRYAQEYVSKVEVYTSKHDIKKKYSKNTLFTTSMDNPALMQVCDSTYYLSNNLFCNGYRVPFLAINFLDISTYAGSKHLGNNTMMSAIWSFDLEVIQKLDKKFLTIGASIVYLLLLEMATDGNFGTLLRGLGRKNFEGHVSA